MIVFLLFSVLLLSFIFLFLSVSEFLRGPEISFVRKRCNNWGLRGLSSRRQQELAARTPATAFHFWSGLLMRALHRTLRLQVVLLISSVLKQLVEFFCLFVFNTAAVYKMLLFSLPKKADAPEAFPSFLVYGEIYHHVARRTDCQQHLLVRLMLK